MYIWNIFCALIFQQFLANKHHRLRDLKSRHDLAERRSVSGHWQNYKKTHADYEPRLAGSLAAWLILLQFFL